MTDTISARLRDAKLRKCVSTAKRNAHMVAVVFVDLMIFKTDK